MLLRTGARLRIAIAASCIVSSAIFTGCEKEEPKSPDDIVSTQGTYAADYPDKLMRGSKDIRAREAKAKEDIGTMPTFMEQLDDAAPPDKVSAIVDAADAAGRDEAYGEEARKIATIRGFYDDEKEALVKKIGGAAQYSVQQKKCDADVWGPVTQGLKDGFDDRIKDRMRKHDDAFLLIDRDRDLLGKKNAGVLEDEADKISEASYIVHVELPDKKKRLDFAIEQAEKEKQRLSDLIKEEKERQSSGKLKGDDQKSSDARIKEWEQQISAFDPAVEDAKSNAKDLEQRVESLSKDYDTAFAAMKDAVKAGKKK